jgi:RNA polymerase sigma factor (sigma-70 family)
MYTAAQFSEWYEALYPAIFRLCKGYFNGDATIAGDATQEIFIKAWENRHTFRGESKPSTWIYRIAVNVCLLYLRKKSYQKGMATPTMPDTAMEEPKGDKEERLQKMYACIQQLDPLNRHLILMVLEGIDYTEIAAITGIKEATIRVKIHRIKQSLTQCVTT